MTTIKVRLGKGKLVHYANIDSFANAENDTPYIWCGAGKDPYLLGAQGKLTVVADDDPITCKECLRREREGIQVRMD